MEYDDIIVGGGSAGAVLAARLSEEPARRILLVEAGPDYPALESTPADLRDGWRMSLHAHDWGLTAEAVPGRPIPYPRGRVTGWSMRLAPTPGRSATSSMPRAASASLGPIPERSRIAGEPMAPAARVVRRP